MVSFGEVRRSTLTFRRHACHIDRQYVANHESPRTTKLYDRRQDEISLDEVERVAIRIRAST